MSRTRRIVGGVGLGQAHLVLVTAVGLFLTPFLLSRVGQQEYGLWLLGLQLTGYLALLDFGVVALLPREVSFAKGRVMSGEQASLLRDTVSRVRGVIRWQLPVVAVVSFVAWWALPDQWASLRGPLAWVMAFFALTFSTRAFHATLQGLQDLVFLGQVQVASWSAGIAVMVGLVLSGHRLGALATGWLVTQGVTMAACWWRIRSRYRHIWAPRVSWASWEDARMYFGKSVWVSASQVAQVLLGGSDVLLIGVVLGPAAVVPYACTAKLIQVLANHPQILMQAASPALSEMRVSESRAKLISATFVLTRAMLVISGGVAVTVIAINGSFVQWWVGPQQYGGLGLTLLLVAGMLVRHLNTTTSYAVFSFGHERRLALTALADGAVTVIASVVLLRFMGAAGAAVGALVGVLSVSLIANFIALGRELGIPVLAPLKDLGGWFARFAVAAIASVMIAMWHPAPGVWQVIARGSVAAVVYGVLIWTFVLHGPLGAYLRPILRQPLSVVPAAGRDASAA
jgi:O-antigen/teichoic acid export membrane protein